MSSSARPRSDLHGGDEGGHGVWNRARPTELMNFQNTNNLLALAFGVLIVTHRCRPVAVDHDQPE
jgi:hypothetical protein